MGRVNGWVGGGRGREVTVRVRQLVGRRRQFTGAAWYSRKVGTCLGGNARTGECGEPTKDCL